MRDEETLVEICHDSDLLSLLEELLLDGALSAHVTFLIQVVDINLLIAVLKVNDICLHGDFCTLLGVCLYRYLSDRELMSRVRLLIKLFRLTLSPELHLDHVSRIVHSLFFI